MGAFSNRRLIIGFALVWAGLIGAVALSFLNQRRLAESNQSVQHTRDLLITYYQYLNELTRLETDSRGYILSGDTEFISNLDSSRIRLWDTYFKLRRLSRDDAGHQEALERLRPLTERKLAFINRLVDLRRRGNTVVPQNAVSRKEGKDLMDRIRQIVDAAVLKENTLLTKRLAHTERVNARSTNLIIASFVVSSCIGLITLVLYRRFSSERKQSLQDLRDFSSLLEGVFESSLSGIMVLKAVRNSAGRIEDLEWVAINDKAGNLLNRRPDTLLGQRLLKVSPHHQANGLFDTYRKVIETGRPVDMEQVVETSVGKSHWFNISVAPIANGVAITFFDITSRKQDALRLEANEANLQALINNTADEVWSVDRSLAVITANRAFLEREKPLDTTELWTRTLQRALRGERFQQEIAVPGAGEGQRLMDYHFNPVIGSDGQIKGVAVFGQDITDKRSIEARNRRQSQLLNAIVKNIPLNLISLKRNGDLTFIEGKALDIYGLKQEELIGRNMLERYPFHRQEIERALQGEPVHFIWQSAAENPERYFDTYLFPDDTGQAAVTGVALDITPLKRSEVALQAAKRRAESASAYKTRFLANMSHEIRTPLSAILGFAEVLRKEEHDERHQEFLLHIESAGTTLLKLIGDILDLTKIEEGMMTLAQERFHLKEVVSSMLHPYLFRAQEKGLEFDLRFLGELPAYLHGDAGKLVQVLVNLVGNALKFTKEGGVEIEITGSDVSDEKLCLLSVSVSDSGIGVPDEKQASVFEAFSQADDGISREFGGSGLGLSIANEMVRLLGGRLELESPSGHSFSKGLPGARFFFTVPMHVDQRQESMVLPSTSQGNELFFEGIYRVLLVEDNPVNQQLGTLILERCGCQVEVASNGKDGISAALGNDYDLILMDVQMPVLDGLTATRAICEVKPASVIVGLSANVYKEDVDECLEAGMKDFLAKPYSTEKMQAFLLKYQPASAVRGSINTGTADATPQQQPTEFTGPNLAYLHNLVGANSSQMRAFVLAYCQVAQEFIDAAEVSTTGIDIAKAAHKLKSSLHLVGMSQLHQRLEQLEHPERGRLYGDNVVFTRLVDQIKLSITVLHEQLETMPT